MSYTLHIAEAAEDDIREAFLWYEEQRLGLGIKFQKSLYAALDSISENPLKHEIRYRDLRVFFIEKFPYGLHFYVNDNQILIIAVFHTSRDSKNWQNRR